MMYGLDLFSGIGGQDTVICTLTELGYDCRWTVVSAAEVGAPHIRERWWILAHAKRVVGSNGFLREGRN